MQYNVIVPENEVGAPVATLKVTDADEENSLSWKAKYSIVKGNEEANFAVTTDPATNNGLLTTAKVRGGPLYVGARILCVPSPTPYWRVNCGSSPWTKSTLLFSLLPSFQELDYETKKQYILHVTVMNEVEFSVHLSTSTATVIVDVSDKNEPPVFDPTELKVSKPENLPIGQSIAEYKAQDPDKFLEQTLR